MDKIIIISGPTATGKTSLAIDLARKFNGELISADSRQIYKGLDIGTGKDHPTGTPLHLIDLIDPQQSFSVAEYRTLALDKIKDTHRRRKLPIVVGGTMQYLQSLIDPRTDTFSIKPNPALRFILTRLPLTALQAILRLLTPSVYYNLNNSDLHNPRRLVRKIEIALLSSEKTTTGSQLPLTDYLHLSLTAPNPILYRRIDTRVDSRLAAGLLAEISKLLNSCSWADPGLNTLAYKEFKPYFENPTDSALQKSITTWKYDEHAYSRRQKTWLKKMPNVNYLDITSPGYQDRARKLVSDFLSN